MRPGAGAVEGDMLLSGVWAWCPGTVEGGGRLYVVQQKSVEFCSGIVSAQYSSVE